MSRHHKEVVAFVLIGISSMSIEDEVFSRALKCREIELLSIFISLINNVSTKA